MAMEQDTKDFIELHFKRLEEKIDGFNESLEKEIIHLQRNDEEHYNLDRGHREMCGVNREAVKKEMNDTLSRFGERIGHIESTQSSCIVQMEDAKKSLDDVKKNMETKKDNFQDWMKTLFPYIMIVAYLIIDKMGVL